MDHWRQFNRHTPPTRPARLVLAVFGCVFGGVGLCVLAFVWGVFGDDGFGGPPLFFRLFASLIAIGFVAIGGAMAFSGLTGKGLRTTLPRRRGFDDDASPGRLQMPGGRDAGGGYVCPSCAAPLGDQADVSPSGDAKCTFCGRWFNIHRG